MIHDEHKDIVSHTKEKMPPTDTLFELADFFKVFGDSTRIRIMCALFEQELNVCCIADIVGMEQSTVSHQLRVLRQENLVKVRREGKQGFHPAVRYQGSFYPGRNRQGEEEPRHHSRGEADHRFP